MFDVEDIPALSAEFLRHHARRMGKGIARVADPTLAGLQRYDWPGNVRELQNVIERAVIRAEGDELLPEHCAVAAVPVAGAAGGCDATLASVEREHIRRVLDDCAWVIEGARGAAGILGLNPSTLRSRMRKLGISR